MADVLERFGPATQDWFRGAFAGPTDAQAGAWAAISAGSHALVVAPTGSGKTLSAFLWAIDRVFRAKDAATPPKAKGGRRTGQPPGTRILYISPLKALGVDVERNLRSPLVGIGQSARRLGIPLPDVTVGVRSGDTTSADRRRLVVDPPDILITTPESLYLMLTSQAGETLRDVHTVIVDEVHAVAATKRGAHLAVSLERLDALRRSHDADAKPAQRIGLSATVRPIDEVARFLGGSQPVEIVAPRATKAFDLRVVVPIDDLSNPPPPPGEPAEDAFEQPDGDGADDWFAGSGTRAGATEATGSVWPHVEEAIVDRILLHRSTIVFVNSRRLGERLTARLNEIYSERLDASGSSPTGGRVPARAGVSRPGAPEGTAGLDTRPSGAARPPDAVAGDASGVLAKAHHGSVSKEQRAQVEDELKSGVLRCVVATSSLELGIDMGAVDLVIQVEAPPSAASGLQRVGRAGHQVGEVSRAALFPKHRGDVLHTAIVTERMLAGQIEAIAVPQNPLDILAQQTVAACATGPVDVEGWYETVRRSAPFRTLPRSAYEATLDLLAGRYPSDRFAELRPRVVWDRDHGVLTGRPGAQRIAVTSGGTIPDRGLFGVFVAGETRNARVGELDEEMVYESRVNDVFTLGTTSWRIVEITHDRVNVAPAFGQPGKVPFWHGDGLGRPAELGEALGRFNREVSAAAPAKAAERLRAAGLDDRAAANLLAYLAEQREATGTLPTDRSLTVERSRDEVGDWRVILHSPYGMHVHAPWALAVNARIRERLGVEGSAVASDDGIIARVPDAEAEPPGAELFVFDPDELEQLVTDEVGGSALFASRFRECAARALLMPRMNPNRRSPLWQQRQRSAQLLEVAKEHPTFPIILETLREVLQDVYDLPALLRIARGIGERRIRLVETSTQQPSPFARDLLFGYVGAFMYEGDSPLAERRAAALSVDPALLSELLGKVEMRELLDPAVVAQFEREAQRLDPERRARGKEGVADLLRMLGPLDVAEVAARLEEPRPGGSPDTDSRRSSAGGEARPRWSSAGGEVQPRWSSAGGEVQPRWSSAGGEAGGVSRPGDPDSTAGFDTRPAGATQPPGPDAAQPLRPSAGGEVQPRWSSAGGEADGVSRPGDRQATAGFDTRPAGATQPPEPDAAQPRRSSAGGEVQPRWSSAGGEAAGVSRPGDPDSTAGFDTRPAGATQPPGPDAAQPRRSSAGGEAGGVSRPGDPDSTAGFDTPPAAATQPPGPDAAQPRRSSAGGEADGVSRPGDRQATAGFDTRPAGATQPPGPDAAQPRRSSAGGEAAGVSRPGDPESTAGFDTPPAAATQPPELDLRPAGAMDAEAQLLLDALVAERRAIPVTIAGASRFAAIEDAGRLRDALGVALPVGIPTAFLEPVADPLGDLVARHARTHGPFRAVDVAERFGIGAAVARQALQRLETQGRATSGFFLPADGAATADEVDWCDAEVLRRLRLRSLAAIRGTVEPVPQDAFARFLPDWQHVARPLEGIDGVAAVIEQLAGVPIPASAWESLVLPSRVRDYAPAMLDELTSSGEVLWSGHGSLPGRDGWIALHPADAAPLTVAVPDEEFAPNALESRLVNVLGAGGAYFAAQLKTLSDAENEQSVVEALWNLTWAGRVTNDTFAPIRTLVTGGSQAHKTARRAPRARLYRGTPIARPTASAPPRPPALGGRWSLLPDAESDPALRATAAASLLLERYGVVTRGSVQAEGLPGGFAQAYRVLAGFEQAGHCRRGYVVERLGAAQFAASATIDRLRQFSALADPPPRSAVVLAATDPANAYGAALAWPSLEGVTHRPGRKAGGLVALVDGALVLYLERGGKSALVFAEDEGVLTAACAELVRTARERRLDTLTIEQVNGVFVLGSPIGRALRAAGFVESTRGLTLRRLTAGDALRAKDA